jgi:D-glycero-alpha-D-manno-heptose-7-phosphate kinase
MSRKERIYHSKAPVRIDFSGGYTDIQPYCDDFIGKSLNISIQSYTNVIGKLRSDKIIKITSLDLDTTFEIEAIGKIKFNGELDIVKQIILDFKIDYGIDIIITCDVQFGTGLGTSASLSIALTMLFCKIKNIVKSKIEIAEYAADVERRIGITGGKQDQYASIFGGINYYEFSHDRVRIKRIKLNKQEIEDLEKKVLLIHPGGHRKSSDLVSKIMQKYKCGDINTTIHLNSLNSMIDSFVTDIRKSDYKKLALKINILYQAQKALNEDMVEHKIATLIDELHRIGFCGIKLTGGAGPGAYLLVICDDIQRLKIVNILNEEKLSYIFPKINVEGASISIIKEIPPEFKEP